MRPPADRRRALPLLLGALVAAAACASGCRRPVQVLLVGDSITAGVVGGAGGAPFAERLGTLLGDDYVLLNIAEGGSSANDWASPRLADRIPAPAPRIASILLGTNDAMGFLEESRLSADAYERALGDLIERLIARGVERVVLMTPPRGRLDTLPLVAGYRRRIFRLCTTRPEVLCGPDVFSLLDRQLDFGLLEGPGRDVHPNGRGHEKIAVALADAIRAAADGL